MTYLILQKDIQGIPTLARDFSALIYNGTVTSGTASSITVPSTYQNWEARITVQYNAICWVSVNNTAAVPAGATFAAATSELINNSTGYEVKVKKDDTISVYNITGSAANISIALYVVQNSGQ